MLMFASGMGQRHQLGSFLRDVSLRLLLYVGDFRTYDVFK